MNNQLYNALDLAPIKLDSQDLVVQDTREVLDDEQQVSEDLDYVRDNLKDIIETGKGALESISNIANQSQHPRAFEVLNGILKTLADVNKDLLEMQQRKKALKNSVYEGPTTVHQHLTVTTAELNKMIEDAQSKKDQ